MTPQEKAQLLQNEFIDVILKGERGEFLPLKELGLCANLCAHKCTEEIIMSQHTFGMEHDYWYEVQTELEKLKTFSQFLKN